MDQLENEILVFKTDLETPDKLNIIKPFLDRHPGILKWNVDEHDIDNVLRIESKNIQPADIIEIANEAGISCEELPD